jgi:hypothetical protein
MKTLIFQAQMLRGSAQLAVQSELRSIMQMASEDRDEAKRSAEGGGEAGDGAGAGADSTLLTEHDDNAPYFSTACHPSNRPYYAPFDVDAFNVDDWFSSGENDSLAADAGASASTGGADAVHDGEQEKGEDGAEGRKEGVEGRREGANDAHPPQEVGAEVSAVDRTSVRRTSSASMPVNPPV